MNKYDLRVKATPDGKIIREVDMVSTSFNEDVQTNILRQVVDTMEVQTREALVGIGWTPPKPIAANVKCVVKGCANWRGEGRFVGDICAPCHHMIVTGNGAYSNTFIGDLYQKAAQLERFKTQLRELTKETT
ncbi:MAG: hypothetical protein NUV51_11730 [Sulfuricaulis sp.]|nr:hypothetical protein [Sulfuricaulis sp.]